MLFAPSCCAFGFSFLCFSLLRCVCTYVCVLLCCALLRCVCAALLCFAACVCCFAMLRTRYGFVLPYFHTCCLFSCSFAACFFLFCFCVRASTCVRQWKLTPFLPPWPLYKYLRTIVFACLSLRLSLSLSLATNLLLPLAAIYRDKTTKREN